MSYFSKRQDNGAGNKMDRALESNEDDASDLDTNYEDDVVDDGTGDDDDDDVEEDEDDKYGDAEQYETLTGEELRRKLRQLGLMLKAMVKEFTSKYHHDNIAFDAIIKSSKKINKCEARLGNYLSLVIRDEEVYQNYTKTHLIKTYNQDKLDKTMAVWLQRFNLHIAELTSYARAKWVAESLVRVFDNEWNALYRSTRDKHVSRVTDQEILECIKDVLQYCYNRCRDFAWRMGINILRHLFLNTNYTMTDCPAVVRLRIREVMKRSTAHTLPFIQKVIKRDIVREPSLRLLLRVHNTQKPPLRTFLDLCSEVTWFMQSQDPPMALEFTKNSEPLNFKPYKTIGADFSFIIWPTVLLHDDGMVLANGVAEFIQRSAPSSPLIQFQK